MANKTRKQNKSAKLIKIKKFDHLVNKPPQPKKGISYAVEKAENIDAKTGKKMDGDIFKKYENGVLKRQIFVPKTQVKKLIQKSIAKVKKQRRITLKLGGAAAAPQQNPQVIYVQAPPEPAQAQQAQQLMVQSNTTSGQAFKEGLLGGAGWAIAHVFIGALFSGDN